MRCVFVELLIPPLSHARHLQPPPCLEGKVKACDGEMVYILGADLSNEAALTATMEWLREWGTRNGGVEVLFLPRE